MPFLHWLRTWLRWRTLERRVDRELQFHLDEQVRTYVAAGMSAEAAHRRARVDFGGVQQIKEQCRDVWILPSIESWWQDLRFGARMLLRNPGFTLIAVLTLGIGIGANAAIFSVVYGVAIRPLPYPAAERLVVLHGTHPEFGRNPYGSSMLDFEDWQEHAASFESMAQLVRWTFNLTGRDVPERLAGGRVTGSFFPLLGVPALLGRTLAPEDDRPGHEFVVVLAHAAWQRVFGGQLDVIGQVVSLNGRPHTIVGVMPATFRFPEEDVLLWAPLGEQLGASERGSRFLFAAARLRDDVALGDAQGEMDVIARRLAQDYPDSNTDWGVRLVSAHDTLVGDVRPTLLVLLAAVGLVLLIACGNVASLLLARASTRQRESAIRAAIGAGRGRLVRQFLTESLLLGALGGTIGIILASWSVRILGSQLGLDIPRMDQVRIDSTVWAFTIVVSMATTVLFGLLPALQGTRVTLNQALVDGTRTQAGGGRGRQRLRAALVVSEVAMALVLLIGAGLLARSFTSIMAVDPGFDPRHVLHLSAFLGPPTYRTVTAQKAYVGRALDRIERLPGVIAAASVSQLPIVDGHGSVSFQIEGRPAPLGDAPAAGYSAVSHRYFEAMAIPIRRGRGVQAGDVEDARLVAVINESMARRYWPAEDPLGQRFRWARDGDDQGWLTVVGIVGDIKSSGLDADDPPTVYAPYEQRQFPWLRWTSVVVRTESDPRGLIAAVRSQLLQIDPNQPVHGIATLADTLDGSVAGRRLNALLVSLFGVVAALLAAIGIYGIVSYHVVQRTHEIGLRRALGAQRRDVLAMVLGQGLGLTTIGLIVGLGGALAVTRYLDSLLFGVTPTDATTFVGVPVLLLVVATVASYVPARRAARVDPLVALRGD